MLDELTSELPAELFPPEETDEEGVDGIGCGPIVEEIAPELTDDEFPPGSGITIVSCGASGSSSSGL